MKLCSNTQINVTSFIKHTNVPETNDLTFSIPGFTNFHSSLFVPDNGVYKSLSAPLCLNQICTSSLVFSELTSNLQQARPSSPAPSRKLVRGDNLKITIEI